ncbi:23S rRNA (adenine(2030)-N(6))-methyltransferase RlmJ [Marilutibacter alkalisoli]|uniref:Ribosomal RNA large subunit methyltransferase J n=1 Tax=Marilutibacter alkalisoli TaxID=2591633 RepID=A0A514BQP3_9GAMM|nr:23S rRNA (adenine(2030)-N(6))-methyltransferase RlmJ [Lysobacter alkalisoli]QDH69718.1 23S rRNA (adenine(2030)-N(6))-methyltransferase RlmJ [Lysobacter alkalisoli]
MNYRHAFHAGNHADVLKHVALLAICDALTAKPAPVFVLDSHAGRGLYRLDDDAARRTGEAAGGIGRLIELGRQCPPLERYLRAVQACRMAHGSHAYPGSPWLLAHALREQDRIAACELQAEEAAALRQTFAGDHRVAVHARDGYAALKALLPPRIGDTRFGRGLVLIDPPYEAQLEEFDHALAALRSALERWPQATYALWYPIKRRRSLQPFLRRATNLPARSTFVAELMVHPDDSPLRMNGSGMLLLNPPWRLDIALKTTLPALVAALGEPGASWRLDWLKAAA